LSPDLALGFILLIEKAKKLFCSPFEGAFYIFICYNIISFIEKSMAAIEERIQL